MCYDGVLVMPREFAVMDEEEMTYVEGGISSKRKWWGIQVVLSGTEAAAFAFGETAFGFVLGAILSIPSKVARLLISAIGRLRGAWINYLNRDNSGVYINFTWANIAGMVIPPVTNAVMQVALAVPITDRK